MGDTETQSNQNPVRGFEGVKLHASRNKIEVTLWLSRLISIVFTIVYFFPIFGSHYLAYTKVLFSGAITSASRLYQRMPRFTFSMQYFVDICSEDSFHYFMYCFIFANIRPVSLTLIPVFLFGLIHFASYSLVILDAWGLNSFWPFRLMISLVELQAMNILQLIALSEIFLMLHIFMLTLMGEVAITTLFIYYQFLMLRCRSRRNPYTRNVLRGLRLTVEFVAYHRFTPAPIRKAILYFVGLLCKIGWYGHESN